MPSFLSNVRGLLGSSSSNSNAGGGQHDGMDHHDNGGHHGNHPGRPTGRSTSSLRHNSSGMTDNGAVERSGGGGGGGGSSSSRRPIGVGAGGRTSAAQQQGGHYGAPGSIQQRSSSMTRRAGGGGGEGQYGDEGGYQPQQYAGGAYGGGQQQQLQGPGSSGSRRNMPGSSPQPVQRAVPGGSSGHRSRRTSGGQPSMGGGVPGHQHPSYRAGVDPASGGNPPLGSPGPVPMSSGGHGPPVVATAASAGPVHCLNPASDINARLDTQVEVRVYPCNNNASAAGQNPKKKFTQFTVKPEGVIIQGTNRHRSASNDLGSEYALHVGRKLQRYELSDTRACQLLVTTHNKSFWVVPAPEAFSRHSGTCRLLGDRKHPLAPHTLQVGDFLRVGSVGVVVIETHNGVENRVLSEEKIQKIMKDTTSSSGAFLDMGETDGENSDDSSREGRRMENVDHGDAPVCYMCFDEEDTEENPLITPCKCLGDTRYVHVSCLRKWHTAEADNQICFLSSVDATCSVCKSTFKSDFKLKDGRTMKLFKSSLEPPYVSLLVATKHEMAQRLFNTRFQLSFSTLLKPDGRNATRPLLLGRSSGSDMVLDYRTVSARHASIRFKNGEFIFTDAGSSNGSYLYLRRPVELTASQPVQFRLGRSMISMKVVNKWNRRLLRAVRRTGGSSSSSSAVDGASGGADDHSVGSNEDDVRVSDGQGGASRSVPRRTRDSIMRGLPAPGTLGQGSPQHLDLLYALAYPKREKDQPGAVAAAAAGRKKANPATASSRRAAPPAAASADLSGAALPARGSVVNGPVPAPLVAPSPRADTPPPASTPRGSSSGLAVASHQQHQEESSAAAAVDPAGEETKEELEEMDQMDQGRNPGGHRDDNLAPVEDEGVDGEDEDDLEEEDMDDDDMARSLPPVGSAEDATAILMMAPTAVSEMSGAAP
uniref:FHA domain-containing protein n=1 Tax=Odontella aurita TaxID=265563 RepID=A0A7S4J1P1_9STRA|mmetsp:Transcript_35901/g.107210  ORF Transcript_35901/g.107210 Transcript_35901/m.107210 type:complete len:933 (+) Transcript_35901:348-3146(+)|eukprot:CAMPEP_0113579032 /NCGR_PEP_ID=MMETSP0015_2-20120614/29839_1 /TAXON_ID=2838 /ORGANISM="Odontella" /LENGTH=932 /DNA_ID=CAMNT_0000482959 /DNA_START=587 /DNA_END=3385 /DNA_ORIENTATION=+ /assembly_acc=CAM_ASM_000160